MVIFIFHNINFPKHLTLLLLIGLIIFSCSDQSSETNSPDINSPNEDCGVDTTFTLDRLDYVIVRSPNCTYTTYGYGGIEMIDELGNVIWSAGGSRTSPYSMNTTSDGGYIFTFTSYVSRSPGPDGDIIWSSELPTYQATHYLKDAIQTKDGDYTSTGFGTTYDLNENMQLVAGFHEGMTAMFGTDPELSLIHI